MVPESILVEILVELIERLRKKNNKLKRKILALDQTSEEEREQDVDRISELEEQLSYAHDYMIEQSKLLDELSYLNSNDVKDLLKQVTDRANTLIKLVHWPLVGEDDELNADNSPRVVGLRSVRNEATAILHVLNEIDIKLKRGVPVPSVTLTADRMEVTVNDSLSGERITSIKCKGTMGDLAQPDPSFAPTIEKII